MAFKSNQNENNEKKNNNIQIKYDNAVGQMIKPKENCWNAGWVACERTLMNNYTRNR